MTPRIGGRRFLEPPNEKPGSIEGTGQDKLERVKGFEPSTFTLAR